LAQSDVDLVSFCSARRDGQTAEAMAALCAGKHVLAEKPMATTQEDLDALRERAARSGRRLWMMLPMPHEDSWHRKASHRRRGDGSFANC
jgi:predicted dehydrogenase